MEQEKVYSRMVRFLHWLIALAVLIMLCVGFILDEIPEQYQGMAYMLHKSTGISILFLMLLRFFWVHVSGKPPLPVATPLWERVLSRLVQYSFYVLLLLMPLSGWILSVAAGRVPQYFGLFPASLPWIKPNEVLAHKMGEAHEWIAFILIGCISLHILGALKHHWINKDNVLKRMLSGKR